MSEHVAAVSSPARHEDDPDTKSTRRYIRGHGTMLRWPGSKSCNPRCTVSRRCGRRRMDPGTSTPGTGRSCHAVGVLPPLSRRILVFPSLPAPAPGRVPGLASWALKMRHVEPLERVAGAVSFTAVRGCWNLVARVASTRRRGEIPPLQIAETRDGVPTAAPRAACSKSPVETLSTAPHVGRRQGARAAGGRTSQPAPFSGGADASQGPPEVSRQIIMESTPPSTQVRGPDGLKPLEQVGWQESPFAARYCSPRQKTYCSYLLPRAQVLIELVRRRRILMAPTRPDMSTSQ